jgi:hypothetical protein
MRETMPEPIDTRRAAARIAPMVGGKMNRRFRNQF